MMYHLVQSWTHQKWRQDHGPRLHHVKVVLRRYVEKTMPQVYEQMPSSAAVATQMDGMQQQINHLRELVANLKPDGFTHMTDMDADIPPNASLVVQMTQMQRQITGLQNFVHRIIAEKVILLTYLLTYTFKHTYIYFAFTFFHECILLLG